MAKLLTLDQVLARVRAAVTEHGSQQKAGLALGCDNKTVNLVLQGKSDPTPKLLEGLGLRKVLRYEELD